ncbi:ferredoxin [candidate division WOR-3 bacterium 4484_100]|uniref:Ferredoxin n=1 Tax=candidate division WOR-3 bacterium 4484_100 TaxID=1936077 RepID=A0A1V4QEC9_UNCW3|nr:MAG: ferredoxin [candidate division WOR-3 bacterium 4484_100]
MSEKKGWRELPIGLVTEPASSKRFETGDWRSERPIWDENKCIHCLICWIYCPDSAIIVKDEKVQGIDYRYCKGCGICAEECPPKVKAITMVREEK